MKDTDKIAITVGDLKRGAEKCETARTVLKEMFPKVFEDKWKDITEQVHLRWHSHGGGGFDIHLYDGQSEIGWVYPEGMVEISGDYNNLLYKIEIGNRSKVFKEDRRTFIRILKRVS